MNAPAPLPAPPNIPAVVYGSFVGSIDAQSIGRIFNSCAVASQNRVREVHLLFQSTGGIINDGVALHNYLRTVPFDLHLYNTGAVQSIAVLAYLAGTHRHVSQSGTFLIHKSGNTAGQGTTAEQFKAIYKSLIADDKRTEAIIKANTNIPKSAWIRLKLGNVTFDAAEAVQFGIAHDIREFVVPPGNQIFNI